MSPTAKIVRCPDFENALAYIWAGKGSKLSSTEKATVQELVAPGYTVVAEITESDGRAKNIAERGRKRLKTERNSRDFYIDTRFLLPTSNTCDRLFSITGNALSDRRLSLSPLHFEEKIFLFRNSDLWGISDINQLVIQKVDVE